MTLIRGRLRSEPWLVPGAIDFLRQYTSEHPGCAVLEFGSGASTIWFLQQDCRVISFEHKPKYREMVLCVAANRSIVTETQAQHLDLREWSPEVPSKLLEWFGPDSFDLVLVDGEDRKGCINNAPPLVRPGGILMLDNAYRQGRDSTLPDWDWSGCMQGTRDKFYANWEGWKPGWTTAWWRRPGPLDPPVYYDSFYEQEH